ncbi:MAG: hypothetical protein WBB01_13150 [Phormidesmis sp.]
MTQSTEVQWSNEERGIAETALKKAYDREVKTLMEGIRKQISLLSVPDDVWQLHDLLSAKRHDIDGKYDHREASLLFTLSRLVKDGLLEVSELEGLAADKQAKVKILTRM